MKKNIINILILAVIFLQTIVGAVAQETTKVTLEEAIDLALKNNLDFKATQLELEIQKNNISTANRLQNPRFANYMNYGQAGKGNPHNLGVYQTIELGKRGPRKNLELAKMALVNESYDFAKFNLKMDVRLAYVELVASKSVMHLVERQKKLYEQMLEIAKQKEAKGRASELEVMQAEVALGQISTVLNTAKTSVQAAKYKFNKVLNIKGSDVFHESVDEHFPNKSDFIMLLTPAIWDSMPEFSSIASVTSNNRFDLKIAKNEIKIAEKKLKVVKSKRIPDVVVGGGYSFVPSSYSGGQGYLNGGYTDVSVVNLPVFYNYSPEIKNASIQVEQAKINYDSVKDQAIYDLSSAYEKFITAQKNLKYYDKNVLAKSELLMDESIKNYARGKSDLTSLIVMEKCYQTIRTGYINALCSYYISWIGFLKEVNNEAFSLFEEKL